MNWQPIATAPADTDIMVACKAQIVGREWGYVSAFRDNLNWRESSTGDDLRDAGITPLWWAELPNEPPAPDKPLAECLLDLTALGYIVMIKPCESKLLAQVAKWGEALADYHDVISHEDVLPFLNRALRKVKQ